MSGAVIWTTVTVVAYALSRKLAERLGGHPVLNPMLIAVILVIVVLNVSDVGFDEYFDHAQIISFFLGPATIALAVPIFRHLWQVRALALPFGVALVAGSLTASGSAVLLAWAMGASPETVLSLVSKSVTTPIAVGITHELGGIVSLTAVSVIFSGIIGAIFGPPLLRLVGVQGEVSQGTALGVAAHGLGTARAVIMGDTAGAFSGLALAINGLATSVAAPLFMMGGLLPT